MKKFIITYDKKIANKLLLGGFQLISEISGVYTFLNSENNFNFAEIDIKKLVYTDRLVF